jgi:ribosomal protein L37AE/L43A
MLAVEKVMSNEEEKPAQKENFTDGIRPQWAGRVKQHLIRRLYENDARGEVDEELINEVGSALMMRCQSILIVTEAHAGRAPCPRCSAIIPHHWDKEEVMVCSQCGWQTTWGAYFKTYQSKQLVGGGAVESFKSYVEVYPHAHTAREKMLLIDQLLHAFHWELIQLYSRPAACNLIGGKLSEVITLLDTLTYGASSAPEVKRSHEEWVDKANKTDWIRSALKASRERTALSHMGE